LLQINKATKWLQIAICYMFLYAQNSLAPRVAQLSKHYLGSLPPVDKKKIIKTRAAPQCKTLLLLIPLIASIFHGLTTLPLVLLRHYIGYFVCSSKVWRGLFSLQSSQLASCKSKEKSLCSVIAVACHVVMLSSQLRWLQP